MKLPAGHARRLFLGFTCSIMFLVVFALLIAHNSEAESANYARAAVDDYPLTIPIPTGNPEGTISFYRQLGFKTTDPLSGGLDMVRMEKKGTPYKLEICHNKSSDPGALAGGVSGMSFRVNDLKAAVDALEVKGCRFQETSGKRDGVSYASLLDPNGISIKLFEP